MRPILEQQTFINTVNLKGTVDGTTENMKFKGVEIENICKDGSKELKIQKTDTSTGKKAYEISLSKLKNSIEYTLFYRVTEISLKEQTNLGKLFAQLTNSKMNTSISGLIYLDFSKPGYYKMKFTTSGTQITDDIKLYIGWQDGDEDQRYVKIKDVMLIEGDWTHTNIPFFEDKKGFGPEITVISHNKNIYYEDYYCDCFLTGSTISKDSDLAYTLIIPVEPSTKYTLSFKRPGKNNPHVADMFYYGWTDTNKKPTKGDSYKSVEAKRGDEREVYSFNTEPKQKWALFYLGFIYSAHKPNYTKEDIIDNIQLEAGGKATPYQPPGFSHKTYNIKHELFAGDVLEYDKDYNKWVINHYENYQDRPNEKTTKWITDVIDPYTYTFNNETWIAVRDQDNILQGSMEFDYFRDPYHAMIGKHMEVIIELLSGEYIDTSLYATIEKNTPETPNPHVPKGCILLKDGRYNNPDRIIVLSDIARIIHLD